MNINMKDYLRLNNIIIPVQRDNPVGRFEKTGDTFEANEGNIRSTVSDSKLEYSFYSDYLTETEMLFFLSLITGGGDIWTFDDEDMYSNKGERATITSGAAYVAGKHGKALDVSGSVSGATFPVTFDDYTVFLYRHAGGGTGEFEHIALLSNGDKYKDGVIDLSYNTNWITISSDEIALTTDAGTIDELFVIPAVITEEIAYMMAYYGNQVKCPYLSVEGLFADNHEKADLICAGMINRINSEGLDGYIIDFSLKEV
jgi:hypothetical protein